MFKEGTKVNFSLKDSEGKMHNLSDYKGKKVILYFYPKDDTPGCTKEACSFRDNYKAFKDKGIVVLGVSKDDSKSHQKFSSKYNLNFPLLIAEPDFLDKWGAFKKGSMFGKTFLGVARITYLINEEGVVLKNYPKVKPEEHIKEILLDVDNLKR